MRLEFELLNLKTGLGTVLTHSESSYQLRTLSKPSSVPELLG